MAPPLVPEIRLRLASEAHDIWLKTEEELEALGLPPPFWAFAWAGGQALARFILDHREWVEKRRVVDFASGSGLVALAAALGGASEVTAVDIDRFASTAFALNRPLNPGAAATIAFCTEDIVGQEISADVLLVGDVFYDREMAAAITPWFEALAAKGVVVLVGDPGRSYLPRDRLSHLATYGVPGSRALEDQEIKRTRVWRWHAEP
ncbi:class I SAM-dependent methyltransferase [Jiella marina]|uniref:class I SAM-dependent methyltransferase n=1 Tax=Jiella sp. LLJ827 TaxID=2917712 RepID=UPI0021017EAD|nr:50S ribosomal protein L11 methyltransferase [Jiella sp. LLJ827]MCQ0987211.1 50S ribosomal protein L11 methyltransferase [Jiella sp. LLJ827]